nr:transporter substrate-binding domain-containing protein [Marinomonas ostreistagni]
MCTTSVAEEITLYTIHFPPYSIDANLVPAVEPISYPDNMYGSDIDLIRAAMATQGIEVKFEILPWKRIMRDVKAGQSLGAVSCRPMAERDSFALFSNTVSYSAMVMATQKDFLGEQKVQPLEVLRKHRPVVIAGWAQEVLLTSAEIAFTDVNNIAQGAALVLHRDQDVFVTDKESLLYVLDQLGIEQKFSFYQIEGIDHDNYTVCFSRGYPDAHRYLQALNRGLDEIKRSGHMASIFERYDMSMAIDHIRVRE